MPAFGIVRDGMPSLDGNLLALLSVATNVLAALTGSATGCLTITLEAVGGPSLRLAGAQGISPALLHRVAVIGAGTLDGLPHNGAVVTLLALSRPLRSDAQGRLFRHRHGGDRGGPDRPDCADRPRFDPRSILTDARAHCPGKVRWYRWRPSPRYQDPAMLRLLAAGQGARSHVHRHNPFRRSEPRSGSD